jgi:hypothetical protein
MKNVFLIYIHLGQSMKDRCWNAVWKHQERFVRNIPASANNGVRMGKMGNILKISTFSTIMYPR